MEQPLGRVSGQGKQQRNKNNGDATLEPTSSPLYGGWGVLKELLQQALAGKNVVVVVVAVAVAVAVVVVVAVG